MNSTFLSQLTRRHFVGSSSTGIGSAALASLLQNPGQAGEDSNRLPPHVPRAKRVIWLTQAGAPSQLELFDFKPQLKDQFNKDLPDSVRQGQRLTGMTAGQARFPVCPSVYRFAQHGQSGT